MSSRPPLFVIYTRASTSLVRGEGEKAVHPGFPLMP